MSLPSYLTDSHLLDYRAFVNKHTRSPRNGREIVCPRCDEKAKVYHFSWTAIECVHCQLIVDKQDWTVALTDKEKYTGATSIFGNNIVMKEVNTKMIRDTNCFINTKDYPDFCDSYFEEAHWIDRTELTEEELEHLQETDGYLYSCIEGQLY
jgi:hypothetical protein